MSRRDDFRKNLLAPVQAPAISAETASAPSAPVPADVGPAKPRVGSGVLRAVGLSLDRLRESADEEARVLKTAIEAGSSVVELDPALIDPSFIRDRLPEGEDPTFEEFKDGIRTHGQKVPILVRPHPLSEGRYEVAYGHRRLRACAQLGRKVRGVVAQFSDVDLVIAQGKENRDRLDPSYIEMAMYAHALEAHPFERPVIMAALSVNKTTLSRLLSLAHAIPFDLAAAIGPARKAGRPRWNEFAERLKKASDRDEIVSRIIRDPKFREADSDHRFSMLFDAFAPPGRSGPPARHSWKNSAGTPIVLIERSSTATKLAIDEKVAPEFGSFLIERLQALYDEFEVVVASKAPESTA